MASPTPTAPARAPKRKRFEIAPGSSSPRSAFRAGNGISSSAAPVSSKASPPRPPPSTSTTPPPFRAAQAGVAAARAPAVDPKTAQVQVQQGKYLAIQQAQREGCLGKYRTFDSPFGNYLVPVIPTRADLFGPQ